MAQDPLDIEKTISREESKEGYALGTGFTLGQYRIVRPLGRGGMGEVYEAENVVSRKHYALKVLPRAATESQNFIDRFRIESRVMSDLRHPHIVQVHHAGEENGLYYLTMDLVAGPDGEPETLEDVLKKRGRLPESEVLAMADQIGGALAYAHAKGVVHRDLKPSNILIDADGTLRVTDFGLAKVVGGDYLKSVIERSLSLSMAGDVSLGARLTQGGAATARNPSSSARALLGTYDYMAPEQKTGDKVSPRTDIYAAGAVLYRMLTGRKPEGMAKPPSRFGCRKAWDPIVRKCLESDPAERPESVDSLRREIAKLKRGRGSRLVRLAWAILVLAGVGYGLWRGGAAWIGKSGAAPVAPVSPAVVPPAEPPPPAPEQPSAEPAPPVAATNAAVPPEELPLAPTTQEVNRQYGLAAAAKGEAERIKDGADEETWRRLLEKWWEAEGARQSAGTTEQAFDSYLDVVRLAEKIQTAALKRAAVAAQRNKTEAEKQEAATDARDLYAQGTARMAEARTAAEAHRWGEARARCQEAAERFRAAQEWAQKIRRLRKTEADLTNALAAVDSNLLAEHGGDSWMRAQDMIQQGNTAASADPDAASQWYEKAQVELTQAIAVAMKEGAPVLTIQVVAEGQPIPAAVSLAGDRQDSGHAWKLIRGGDCEFLIEPKPNMEGRLWASSVFATNADWWGSKSIAVALEERAPGLLDVIRVNVGGGIPMELAWIPAGTFQMGSPGNTGNVDERPAHEVAIRRGFWMGRTEVTQRQYEKLMSRNPSRFKARGLDAPVDFASWDNAKEFCARLQAALPAALQGATVRLPTEAEWEYACRAGSGGDHAGVLDEMGWYARNGLGSTHPAGQKSPNAWGLFDMHGNVWEWCEDGWRDYFAGAKSDPWGASREKRMLRGGSFADGARDCRSARRNVFSPGYACEMIGFRVIVVPQSAP